MAIYNLVIFSKILESVRKNDIEGVEKIVAIEMGNNVKRANDGNKDVASHMDKELIDLVCKNLNDLRIKEKLTVCN